MNFIWFLLATVFFNLFYWHVLFLIVSLPSIPIMVLIGYLTEHTEKRWTKIALVPTFLIGFIFGTLLPCALFGMGMGVIALIFAEEATHPIVYFLLAGFGAFAISAPSGETSLPGRLISLVSYVITVRIQKFATFSEITIIYLVDIFLWVASLLILIGIVFWIIEFLNEKIPQNQKYVKWYGVVLIIFLILGALGEMMTYSNTQLRSTIFFLFFIASIIGLAMKKKWGSVLVITYSVNSILPVLIFGIRIITRPLNQRYIISPPSMGWFSAIASFSLSIFCFVIALKEYKQLGNIQVKSSEE